MKGLYCALSALFFCAATFAQNQPHEQAALTPSQPNGPALTLHQAEAIALKNNPQITIGKLQALAAQQNVRETRAALLPSAYLSITGVEAHDNSRISAGGLNNPIIFPRAAAGVTVNQLVTDFGRTSNLVSSSEYRAKAQGQLAMATSAQIILAVDEAFFNALETKALVTVAQGTLGARQTFVDKIQALTNAKLKSDLDLSFAKVDDARAQTADLQTEVTRKRLADLKDNIARDVRNSWQDTNRDRAYERLAVTRQPREQAALAFYLAQSRYNLGLSSIVEFIQAELQTTEADIAGTDAEYQYRLTQIVLAFTMSAPK
jgi:outer membrane protein TolC